MKNKLVYLLGLIAIILIAVVIVLFVNNKNFVPPKIDSSSKSGIPTNIEQYGYKQFKISDDYNVAIAGKPKLNDKHLYIYFTSNDSSKYLFKLKIYKKDILISETGLIEPNHYIEKIKVGSKLNVGDDITYKIMSYERDTYYSAGEVLLNVKVW